MKDSEDVQKLLRLKRYESPGELYFERFAEEFKERQRAELLRSSARSILAERVSVWFEELSPNRWAFPVTATACAAALTIGAVIFLQSEESASQDSGMAEVSTPASTLPDFPEASSEVIELSLPKPFSRVPGELVNPGDQILTAGAGRGFREL